MRRRAEHDEGEHRREGGRDAILVRHHLDREDAAARFQAPARALEQANASRLIEMVQEIGEEHEVETLAPIDLEGAAGLRSVALGNPRGPRILLGDRQHRLPIDRDDLGPRNGLRDRYAEEAVTRVEQSRQIAAQARAQYFPFVNYSVSASDGKNEFVGTVSPNGGQERGAFVGVATAAWEADVWGRLRRENEAARAQYLATEEARRGVMLSLVKRSLQCPLNGRAAWSAQEPSMRLVKRSPPRSRMGVCICVCRSRRCLSSRWMRRKNHQKEETV